MKNWLRFVLKVNHKLDKMCFNIERKIDRLSKNLYRPAVELCDEIYDWTDFKRRLVNLRVLHNSLVMGLEADEWEKLGEWKDFKRGIDKDIVQKCKYIFDSCGYDEVRFVEDYQKNKKLLETFVCD